MKFNKQQSLDHFNFDPSIQQLNLVFGIINKCMEILMEMQMSIGEADVHAAKEFVVVTFKPVGGWHGGLVTLVSIKIWSVLKNGRQKLKHKIF